MNTAGLVTAGLVHRVFIEGLQGRGRRCHPKGAGRGPASVCAGPGSDLDRNRLHLRSLSLTGTQLTINHSMSKISQRLMAMCSSTNGYVRQLLSMVTYQVLLRRFWARRLFTRRRPLWPKYSEQKLQLLRYHARKLAHAAIVTIQCTAIKH